MSGDSDVTDPSHPPLSHPQRSNYITLMKDRITLQLAGYCKKLQQTTKL